MNMYTKEIAKILNVSIDQAKLVQDYIEENFDIDYSECTTKQLHKYALVGAVNCNLPPLDRGNILEQ